MVNDDHVAQLNSLVRRMRSDRDPARQVPWFDPLDGGNTARFFFLLESPGPSAMASGFISANNPDQTALAMWQMRDQARLRREDLLVWNIVPWFLPSSQAGATFRAPTDIDRDEAQPWLIEVLNLCPRLEAVITQGRHAERGWLRFTASERRWAGFKHIHTPHPSPQNLRRRPDDKKAILSVLRQLASVHPPATGHPLPHRRAARVRRLRRELPPEPTELQSRVR